MLYYKDDECCEAEDCVDECNCDSHSNCIICGVNCGCMCDELYENYRDSLID